MACASRPLASAGIDLEPFSNTQSGFTANFPHMLDVQARHCAHILERAFADGVTVVETSQEAEDRWVETILSLAMNNQKFLESCTPGYYNNEGVRPPPSAIRSAGFGGTLEFIDILRNWRNADELTGLELTRGGSNP